MIVMLLRMCAVVLAVVVLALFGLVSLTAGVLTGEVSYREQVALPADAVLEASLLDVTLMGRPGELIAGIQLRPKPQLPIPFAIHFGDGDIDPRRSYVLSVNILAGGRLVFVSTPTPRVLTQGHPATVQITLTAVSLSALGITPAGLIDKTWLARKIKGGPVLEGVQSTIRINEAGDVSGTAGCNSLHGTAQFDGQSLVFGGIAATRRMCPPSVMLQEAEFLHALDLTRQFQIEGAFLELLGADGGEVARFVHVP